VQPHLTGVDIGEEVLADDRDQPNRGQREPEKCSADYDTVREHLFEQAAIAFPEFLELSIESLVNAPDSAR
jgi:hypothetical protein